jgi:hypothetical protein
LDRVSLFPYHFTILSFILDNSQRLDDDQDDEIRLDLSTIEHATGIPDSGNSTRGRQRHRITTLDKKNYAYPDPKVPQIGC